MVLNSLNFCLSEKLLISPILNEILATYNNLGCRFFPFPFQYFKSILPFHSGLKHMGFPLYVTCCFSLAAFNILSLCLVIVSLISMRLGVLLLQFILYGTLHLLDLIDHFFFHVGEIFNYNLFKNFLIPFLFLPFFWNPYNSNAGAFDIVPEVSETILSSFCFILLFRSYFHHLIFRLTDSFFFRYSSNNSF